MLKPRVEIDAKDVIFINPCKNTDMNFGDQVGETIKVRNVHFFSQGPSFIKLSQGDEFSKTGLSVFQF